MYPKDFFDRFRPRAQAGTCFVIMPFSPEFGVVFRSIKKVLENGLGLTCVRTDELLGGGNIIEDILRSLATSELVVVDVTGKNPNVFYELGIAHMCKPVEKVILLSQEVESIPFDLRPFRHIVYRPSAAGLKEMSAALGEAVGAVGEKIHRIVLGKNGRGTLPDKLMGEDRCLYAFEVNGAAVGAGSAKVGLAVTRYVMGDGHSRKTGGNARLRSSRVFNGGMGLRVGEPTPIRGTEWSIVLERATATQPCFRIIRTRAVAANPDGGQLSARKARRAR